MGNKGFFARYSISLQVLSPLDSFYRRSANPTNIMGYSGLIYKTNGQFYSHFVKSLTPNRGKSKIPLFAILSISCQIRENSLIWSSLIWSHDCTTKFLFLELKKKWNFARLFHSGALCTKVTSARKNTLRWILSWLKVRWHNQFWKVATTFGVYQKHDLGLA